MCGIAGFVGGWAGAPGAEGVLRAMLARLAHRGPDGEGVWLHGAAALGHRRLSIIDLAGGAQPMVNHSGALAVVFNGEIYNYKELTAQLQAAGHRFATHSDTEVLLHGYQQWGAALPTHLRGMFAFALWDAAAQTLFCARDAFGIKPLYYYTAADGTLLFGSEIKCFLPHPAFVKQFNEAQLEPYLSCQYSPGPDTFFVGVKKLPPAHSLTLCAGKLELTRWWQPEFAPEADPERPLAQWQNEIDAALQNSVAAHKIADVEVGSFLSGGVDSGYITALAGVQHTFTVGFAGAQFDETDAAKTTARRLGVQNTACRITPGEFWAALGKIQYQMDEPLADAAAAGLYFVNREAAKRVKVCLSGEGADELFGGYNIYKEPFTARWYDRLPAALRRALGAVAGVLPPMPGVNFLARRAVPLAGRYIGPTCLMSERAKRRLLRHYTGQGQPTAFSRPLFAATRGLDAVTRMQSCDAQLWLAGDILLKADKMSMAHSLELRVPFLDREVFALAARLPARYKADARQTKIALRGAAARHLPPQSAGRKKLGFPVPVRSWLRQEPYASRVRAAFAGPVAARFFHTRVLHTMLNQHLRGKRDNWRQIWCVYCFLVWYEQYFGNDFGNE